MTWYPGWDSLDSVRTWHTVFEISGIAFLALLVGAEIFAFQYGHRKDELTAIAETIAAANRQANADVAESRRKAETEALQFQLSEAEKRVAEAQRAAEDATKKASKVETQQADRRLSEEQKRTIGAAIFPHPGQKVRLDSLHGDSESYRYAQEFGEIFQAAKWEIAGGDVAQVTYTGGVPEGIEVMISAANGAAGIAPIGAGKLMMALISLGLIVEGHSDPSVQGDEVLVRVGRKPRP